MEHARPLPRPPRTALAQIAVVPGHPDRNLATILAALERARSAGAELVAFPEMAVPGYLVGDDWENERFIEDCLAINEELCAASRGLTLVWGSVDADPASRGEDGRWLKHNAAFIARDGAWLDNGVLPGRTYKTLLPAYREFEDKRHFASLEAWAAHRGRPLAEALRPFPWRPAGDDAAAPFPVGLMLCEDMWDADYHHKPGALLTANGARLLINLSCSPWTWRKDSARHRVAAALCAQSGVPLAYVNTVGIQNNGKDIYAFDGGSTFYAADGRPAAGLPPFAEELLIRDPAEPAGPAPAAAPEAQTAPGAPGVPAPDPFDENDALATLTVLLNVLRTWFRQAGNPQAAIGLSGGIDSALVATLLALAIGPERVWAVNMPSRFNSATTRGAARQLAANLGINYAVVPIEESVAHTIGQTEGAEWTRPGLPKSPAVRLTLSGLNKENIQARDRGGRVLAALASAIGGVFTNNGNKTETAFGYATLYGDVNGALAPIGDLYKIQVYALSRLINRLFAEGSSAAWPTGFAPAPVMSAPAGDGLIPRAILEVVPSAELSENQNVDEGKGDPIIYEWHDRLLAQFVDGGRQPDYRPAWARRDPYDLLVWYLDGSIDRRLGLPEGSARRHFPSPAAFCRDLEEKWAWYKRSVFKRIQAPPIVALSRRAFGFDLRESTNGIYLSRRYRELRDRTLAGS